MPLRRHLVTKYSGRTDTLPVHLAEILYPIRLGRASCACPWACNEGRAYHGANRDNSEQIYPICDPPYPNHAGPRLREAEQCISGLTPRHSFIEPCNSGENLERST